MSSLRRLRSTFLMFLLGRCRSLSVVHQCDHSNHEPLPFSSSKILNTSSTISATASTNILLPWKDQVKGGLCLGLQREHDLISWWRRSNDHKIQALLWNLQFQWEHLLAPSYEKRMYRVYQRASESLVRVKVYRKAYIVPATDDSHNRKKWPWSSKHEYRLGWRLSLEEPKELHSRKRKRLPLPWPRKFNETENDVDGSIKEIFISSGSASGVWWREWMGYGFIVTNFHVVAESLHGNNTSDCVRIKIPGNPKEEMEAQVHGIDRDRDLAVIRVSLLDDQERRRHMVLPKPLRIGNSRFLRVGQTCFAMGFPNRELPVLTRGIISALDDEVSGEWNDSIPGYIHSDGMLKPTSQHFLLS
jgi:S1-C subfamily serine protease